MAGHLLETGVIPPLLAGEDQVDGGFEIVVDAEARDAAPELEGAPVRIENHLLRFT
jgi:hypothetical protein